MNIARGPVKPFVLHAPLLQGRLATAVTDGPTAALACPEGASAPHCRAHCLFGLGYTASTYSSPALCLHTARMPSPST